jgi:hypothetical protein
MHAYICCCASRCSQPTSDSSLLPCPAAALLQCQDTDTIVKRTSSKAAASAAAAGSRSDAPSVALLACHSRTTLSLEPLATSCASSATERTVLPCGLLMDRGMPYFRSHRRTVRSREPAAAAAATGETGSDCCTYQTGQKPQLCTGESIELDVHQH